jgi:hypothetical protein
MGSPSRIVEKSVGWSGRSTNDLIDTTTMSTVSHVSYTTVRGIAVLRIDTRVPKVGGKGNKCQKNRL